jgi:hypothetical protein
MAYGRGFKDFGRAGTTDSAGDERFRCNAKIIVISLK